MGAGVLKMISPNFMFNSPNPKVRQVDFHGGYTAAAGHALYTARAYPKEYWNRTAFVAEPTGHIVGTFVLEPQGSDFRVTTRSTCSAASTSGPRRSWRRWGRTGSCG
jgi:hypothetical protein